MTTKRLGKLPQAVVSRVFRTFAASWCSALIHYVYKRRDIPTKDMLFAGIYGSFSKIPYVWFVFPYIVQWTPTTALHFSVHCLTPR